MSRNLILSLILGLLLATVSPFSVHAYSHTITISVSEEGFNQSGNYMVEVEAGHEVTITFTYDEHLDRDNPHEIQILGLGLDLPTVTVSKEHPTASITFTPTKTGILRILCIIPCIGMDQLLGGAIRVVEPHRSGAQTLLFIQLEPRADGGTLARAVLQDARGNPVGDVPILFTLTTAVGGELELGTPITINDGSAVIAIPITPGQILQIAAQFEGEGGLGFSEASTEISGSGEAAEYVPSALASPSPPPLLALILLIVLGGVWAIFGSALYQVFRITQN